jgi:hypothetical protein
VGSRELAAAINYCGCAFNLARLYVASCLTLCSSRKLFLVLETRSVLDQLLSQHQRQHLLHLWWFSNFIGYHKQCCRAHHREVYLARHRVFNLSLIVGKLLLALRYRRKPWCEMSIRSQEPIWLPLNSSKSEIRLLRLHGEGRSVRGSLEVRSLNHHPRYDAISHAWGRPESSELFVISSEPSDLMVLIPTSLYHCLQTFKTTLPASTLFWVDAIW